MKKILVLIAIIFLLVGCKKNQLTKEIFYDKGSFNGYILEENKTGYEKYNYVVDVYYAINRENAYDIQLLELINEDYAKKMFDINKKSLIDYVNNNSYIRNYSKSHYALYHVETESNYLLVIRSGKYILYVDAPINYINEIEEFLEDMDLDY